MQRRALFFSTIFLLGGLVGSLIGGAAWLSSSENGLQTVVQFISKASAGRLHIEQASGRLLGPLDIATLSWETADLQLRAEQIHLDWSPTALLQSGLQIAELSLGKLHITSAPSTEPTPPPTSLLLPVAVNVKKLVISRLEYGNTFVAERISGQLSSDGRQHHLSDFQIETSGASLHGEATLDGAAPLPLNASAEITGLLEQHPLALSLKASGPLERIALAAIAHQGIEGQAQVELTPFAPTTFASAKIALDNIDPAAWQDGAPSARLSLRADLGPAGKGVAGSFTVSNALPGLIDRQRLPLNSLTGRLAWQDSTTRLEDLKAALPGGSELAGSGQWQNDGLELDLSARSLDVSKIHSSLRSTRLNGPISATLSTQQQAIKLDLKDSRFTVLAEASLSGQRVSLPRLEIGSGQARLSAKGELSLDKAMAFSAEGELSRFDPSQFAKAPAALINARFSTQGKLSPRPIIDGRFELLDSKMAGEPLAGRGQLSIDWPRIPQADIQLTAGPNKLNAKGAFGRPGDKLLIDIEAPQLAPYGLEGGITGHLNLAGSLEQLQLAGQVQAAKLGLPGVGRLSGLMLKADIAGLPNSPLHLDLNIAQLGTSAQPDLLKALHVVGEGSNQAHRLRGKVELAGKTQLSLALEGGLNQGDGPPTWQGRLLEAQLKGHDKTRNLKLNAAAPLKLAAQGWSFGPAELAGDPLDWVATLQAAADSQHLNASLRAKGTRVGLIDGQLKAGMQGAWSLDTLAPWQGSLKTEIADLGWLAELINEQWKSAGSFNGELKLSGTPAQPVSSGRFRGEKLALRIPDSGLNLANGELSVNLDNNLLRIQQLSFDSLLQAAPRTLRLRDPEAMAALTKKPGRLEISGEMRVDRGERGDNVFLDVRLDRLGVLQLADQWVVLSGDGRLSLQGDTLGAKGKLAVDAGYWQLAPNTAPRLSDDVTIKRPGSEPGASSLRPKLDLDISTDLGRNFLFKGAGLSSRLAGDIRLRASGRDLPRATGSIRARDGRFDAYGQQLSIERGVLTFQGLLDNPALDVRAVRKGLAVEAGVQISGTAQRPIVRLVSDPDLPDAEKLTWLVLGHGPDQMSAGDATVLLSAAGGLLGNDSGNLVQKLKSTFGFDEFGVRQGDIGGTGSRQPSSRVAGSSVDTTGSTGNQILSVGKRLSSNAVLSYEQSLGKAESIVKLTVSLTRQVSVIGRAGSDNALDIFYTITFGAQRDRGRRPVITPEQTD
ncbi:MAG: translocation/assembly module TamB domain-containing protein [Betaproteobacteria bacterium]|nr:translocation/assembly module TamB domain-containing protein [Betaproteobacteria bacterium]